MKPLILALLLLAVSKPGYTQPALRLTPPEWNFGTVPADGPVLEQAVVLENTAGRPVRVSLISTCSCLSVEPAALSLGPQGKGTFRLRYDPSEDSGEVQKDLVVRSDLPGLEKALYTVYGRVTDAPRPADGSAAEPTGADVLPTGSMPAGVVSMQYYHSPGCAGCRRFLERTLPAAARRLGVEARVEPLSIMDPQVYVRYRELLKTLGEAERAYPALVIIRSTDGGRTVLQGDREIERRLEATLRAAAPGAPGDDGSPAGGQSAAPAAPDAGWEAARPALVEELTGRLAFLPVLAAGLLDGINPCAFTTLIFLLAALSFAGRGRREILLIGSFFSLAVLATYFLIGLGLFQALRLAEGFPWMARLLRLALIGALAVLSMLSLVDFFLIRTGRANRILLQLPGALKRQIHASIRSRAGSLALVSSSLVLGCLVSVFELACTGQVYFPTLAYLARVRRQTSAFFYLTLYNLGFITPLLVVFGLTWAGTTSREFTAFLQRSLGPVKLALAILFAGLAILTGLS